MDEEIIQKIYKLTSELASQQQNNQELTSNVTSQLSDLKSKASTKYSVEDRKIQVPSPLLPEQRDEVIEQLKSKLERALKAEEETSIVNKQLENEIKELQALVKEYEVGLETVTSKLRSHANATTEGQLRLRREYEALLNAEKGTTAALFIENTMLQTQLRKLSECLREAYKEEAIDLHEQEIFQLKKENEELLKLLNIPRYPYQEVPNIEKSSPVIPVVRTGIVEEFFTE